jgi:hypothetical protein
MYRVKTKILKKQIEMHLIEKNGAPWSEKLHRIGLLLILIVVSYGISVAEYRKLASENIIIIEQALGSEIVRIDAESDGMTVANEQGEAEDGDLAKNQDSGDGLAILIAEAFPENPEIMIAIAKAESGMNPQAVNYNRNGSIDTGLFQVNSVHGYDGLSLFDPEKNIKAAREIYDKQGIQAWTSFNNGSYKKFLINSTN